MQYFLNFFDVDVDVFYAVVCAVINWAYKVIHFPTILIADATNALALITALGDLPFAK